MFSIESEKAGTDRGCVGLVSRRRFSCFIPRLSSELQAIQTGFGEINGTSPRADLTRVAPLAFPCLRSRDISSLLRIGPDTARAPCMSPLFQR
jgi:hypothetical protein